MPAGLLNREFECGWQMEWLAYNATRQGDLSSLRMRDATLRAAAREKKGFGGALLDSQIDGTANGRVPSRVDCLIYLRKGSCEPLVREAIYKVHISEIPSTIAAKV
jgi:hypothetical protein